MYHIIIDPKLTPILINDEYGSYITNQSAFFNWTINKTECAKLNGLFQGYQVILKVSILSTIYSIYNSNTSTQI